MGQMIGAPVEYYFHYDLANPAILKEHPDWVSKDRNPSTARRPTTSFKAST